MNAASGRVGSCTTAAELKSNVARCLYSPRARGHPHGFTRYRLAFDCLAVTFYFQQHAVVARPFTSESNYDFSPPRR